jgi:putative PIN family toxin of toxin-antitoxin system
MTGPIRHVVFDCVVFAQALINPDGPSGICVEHAMKGHIRLFVSDYVVEEIRQLDGKLPAKYGVTSQQINDLADQVILFGTFVMDVPSVYVHTIDPDDSHYVDLAVATQSTFIVTRDRHLLNLVDLTRPESAEFTRRFPNIAIVAPDSFVRKIQEQHAE